MEYLFLFKINYFGMNRGKQKECKCALSYGVTFYRLINLNIFLHRQIKINNLGKLSLIYIG